MALNCVTGQFRPRWAAVVCSQQWPAPAASKEGAGALGALRTMIRGPVSELCNTIDSIDLWDNQSLGRVFS